MNNTRNLTIGVVVIVLLAIVGFAVYKNNEKNSATNTGEQTSLENASDQTQASSTSPTSAQKLSYGEAIKKYTNRFQFVQCHGNPGYMSVKKGTAVMFDNRDTKAHTFKANGQTFTIKADDYYLLYPSIVTKDNPDLTASNVTCDGGGAAQLNVER